MLIIPRLVKRCPFLACLVGITQSNISMPKWTDFAISTGKPTPIRYLGLFFFICGIKFSKIASLSISGSPTASPPIAYPSKPISWSFSSDSNLRSLYIPP